MPKRKRVTKLGLCPWDERYKYPLTAPYPNIISTKQCLDTFWEPFYVLLFWCTTYPERPDSYYYDWRRDGINLPLTLREYNECRRELLWKLCRDRNISWHALILKSSNYSRYGQLTAIFSFKVYIFTKWRCCTAQREKCTINRYWSIHLKWYVSTRSVYIHYRLGAFPYNFITFYNICSACVLQKVLGVYLMDSTFI